MKESIKECACTYRKLWEWCSSELLFQEAKAQGCSFRTGPELEITGYGCEDERRTGVSLGSELKF